LRLGFYGIRPIARPYPATLGSPPKGIPHQHRQKQNPAGHHDG
jgi:hypothetical protein